MDENRNTQGFGTNSGTTYQDINQNTYNTPTMSQMEYNEPKSLHKWNWGAFMFNMIWGIGNKSYLTFLCLVPFLNIVWVFVCGAKGNQWAWDSGCFKTADEFDAAQATWNRAGIASFILYVFFIVVYIAIFIPLVMTMINMVNYGIM